MKVSCTASSTSPASRRIPPSVRWTRIPCRRTRSSKASVSPFLTLDTDSASGSAVSPGDHSESFRCGRAGKGCKSRSERSRRREVGLGAERSADRIGEIGDRCDGDGLDDLGCGEPVLLQPRNWSASWARRPADDVEHRVEESVIGFRQVCVTVIDGDLFALIARQAHAAKDGVVSGDTVHTQVRRRNSDEYVLLAKAT